VQSDKDFYAPEIKKKEMLVKSEYPSESIIDIWQCVKTNSTPSVHIKIAGLTWISSSHQQNGIFIGIN